MIVMENEKKDSSDTASSVSTDEKLDQPSKKKSRKKLWTILGIVAVVVVAAGAGFWVWHEQPSFCNAICHDPMDPYVEGYFSEDSTLLVTAHAEAGDTCMSCHPTDIAQQLNELGVYISGDFTSPMAMTKNGTKEFCAECHDLEEIKTKTENYGGSMRNPHDSHYGDSLECYSCHRVHRESVMYCYECHKDIESPEGWA